MAGRGRQATLPAWMKAGVTPVAKTVSTIDVAMPAPAPAPERSKGGRNRNRGGGGGVGGGGMGFGGNASRRPSRFDSPGPPRSFPTSGGGMGPRGVGGPPPRGGGIAGGRGKAATLPAWKVKQMQEEAAGGGGARSSPAADSGSHTDGPPRKSRFAPVTPRDASQGNERQTNDFRPPQQFQQRSVERELPMRGSFSSQSRSDGPSRMGVPKFGMPQQFSRHSGDRPPPPTQHQHRSMPTQRPPPPSQSMRPLVAPPKPTPKDTQGWTEHPGPNGKPYFYHAASGKSVWEKPDPLKTAAELAAACDWKAYPTPNGDRQYYHNKKTGQSVWTEPPELKAVKAATAAEAKRKTEQEAWDKYQEELKRREAARPTPAPTSSEAPNSGANSGWQTVPTSGPNGSAAVDNTAATVNAAAAAAAEEAAATAAAAAAEKKKKDEEKKKRPKKPRVLPVYKSKEDALAAFLSLLEAKHIGSKVHWNELVKKVSYDVRWEAIKSIGERRQIFAEYRHKKRKQELLEARTRVQVARADFEQMLRETTDLNPAVRFREAEAVLEKDARFKAVANPNEREEIYVDFMAEWEDKERAERKAKRDAAVQKFKALLQSVEDAGTIKASSKWDDVKETIKDHPDFEVLPRNDRYELFKARVAVLKKIEDEAERKKRREAKEKARQVEDSLKKFLATMRDEANIDHKTTYDDVKTTLLDVPEYAAAEELKAGFVLEVFNDYMERLHIKIRRLRRDLDPYCALIHPEKLPFEALAFADFKAQLIVNGTEPKTEHDESGAVKPEDEGGKKPDTAEAESARVSGDGADAGVNTGNGGSVDENGAESNEGDDSAEQKSKKRKHSSEEQSDETKAKEERQRANAEEERRVAAEKKRMQDILNYATALLQQTDLDLMSGIDGVREDRVKELERLVAKQKKLEDSFNDLLQHYYYRSDHIAVTWETALRRVRHRSAYRDLAVLTELVGDEGGSKPETVDDGEAVTAGKAKAMALFSMHITMLREKMGATEEDIRKAEEESKDKKKKKSSRKSGGGSEGESDADDKEDGDEDLRKKIHKKSSRSKKDKKSSSRKKSSRKSDKKRARRSHSSSSSSD